MLAKDFLIVGIFTGLGIVFVAISLFAAYLVRPHSPTGSKLTTYECGEDPIGPAWLRFRVGYYNYALAFLIFDVEAVFIYPWAAQMLHFSKDPVLATLGLVDMFIFTSVLAIGLVYVWKKGVLEWR